MRLATCLTIVLLLALALGGCATGPTWFGGDWERSPGRIHDALREGVKLVQWSRGRGKARETRYVLEVKGVDVDIDSTEELATHCKDLLVLENAIAYSDLVRRIRPGDAPVSGIVVLPDPTSAGAGGSGTYTVQDATRWGIEFEPEARKFAGGVEVAVLVLVVPVQHADLGHFSPFRLLRQEETIYPDGTVHPGERKTVTNGDDAKRFAVY